jgi:hypothetical protein
LASAPQPAGTEPGNATGDWLFKQGDILLGPVPAKSLIDKLYRGEIDGRTPVARDGSDDFVALESIEQFKVHAKKAQVKVLVQREDDANQAQQSRARLMKVSAFGVVGALLLAGGAYGAYWLAVHKPWRNANDADLVMIEVDPPKIALAVAGDEGVAVDVPTGEGPKAATPAGTSHHGTSPKSKHAAPTPGPGPQQPAEPDGMTGGPTFDQEALRQAANAKMAGLRSCIVTEAKQHPEQPGHLQFELHVSSGGKVSKVWIEPPFSAGPLHDCVEQVIGSWTFPKYTGEEANVTLGSSWKAIQPQ